MRSIADLEPSDLSVRDEETFKEWREAREAGEDGTRKGNVLAIPAVALMVLAAIAWDARPILIPFSSW